MPSGNPQLTESFRHWRLARRRFYFPIHPGSIKSPHVVLFLQHLWRHIPGQVLILWGGEPIHRSVLVKNFVASTRGRITVERLPAYAPELNPVECAWGHLKSHEIANLLVPQALELSFEAAAAPASSPPATTKLNFGPDIILLCETK